MEREHRSLAHTNVNIKHRRSKIVSEIVCLSVHEIIGKKRNDMVVKLCFLQDESEEVMV